MDSRTGKLIAEDEYNELSESEKRYFFKLDYEAKKEIEKYDGRYRDIQGIGSSNSRVKNNMRNKPCPCGSGVKYKKCCLTNKVY